MRNESLNQDNFSEEVPQHAVSIYGQNEGVEDFPVLKAFQQYIDAEQEKARKRIMWLGVLFGAVLLVVIVVFMLLLHGINARNQALSDRLFEYAMDQASRRQPISDTPNANDAALKAITESLKSVQMSLQETKKNEGESKEKRQTEAEDVKLERAKALLAAEKERLAVEKERLHQIEIEQQRRKLYPELYDDSGARTSSPSRPRTRTLTDADIREIIREAYPDDDERPQARLNTNRHDSRYQEKESDADDDNQQPTEAIEYYKDDEYTIPVDIKGTSSKIKFTVPVK